MTETADRGGRYGAVHESFWTSPTTGSLSDDGKLLALYLMTCGHNTIAGVLRLPDGYASADLGWEVERVRATFGELERAGFARRCPATHWVWIVRHFRWNAPANPNQRKAIRRVAHSIPDVCQWLADFWPVVEEVAGFTRPAGPAPGDAPPPGRDDDAPAGDAPGSADAPPPADDGNAPPPEVSKGTAYGLVARAIRKAGMADVSPGHPEFRALVDAGAAAEEFVAFVAEALSKDKPFAYLIASVAGSRRRAADMSKRIRHGPMPGSAGPPGVLSPQTLDAARARLGFTRSENNDTTIEMTTT